jgi:hypothetical protein
MKSLKVPRRRYGDWIKNAFFLLVLKFIIIDWPWFLFLLLCLEPAEAKEENILSCSVVYTDNVSLENKYNRVRSHEPKKLYKTNIGSLSVRNIDFDRFSFDSRAFCSPLSGDDRMGLKKTLPPGKGVDGGCLREANWEVRVM